MLAQKRQGDSKPIHHESGPPGRVHRNGLGNSIGFCQAYSQYPSRLSPSGVRETRWLGADQREGHVLQQLELLFQNPLQAAETVEM
jgi:hypothetical protein